MYLFNKGRGKSLEEEFLGKSLEEEFLGKSSEEKFGRRVFW
jgi:hypothetical protein